MKSSTEKDLPDKGLNSYCTAMSATDKYEKWEGGTCDGSRNGRTKGTGADLRPNWHEFHGRNDCGWDIPKGTGGHIVGEVHSRGDTRQQ